MWPKPRESVTLLIVEVSELKDSSMERRRTEVGDAVQQCLRETSEAWFSEHAGLRSREEAYHTDIKAVTGCFEVRQGGILEITVSITGKTREQIRTDWYPYEKRGKLGYVRREAKQPR